MASPIASAIRQICEEKNIPLEVVVEALEAALAAAYRKEYGQSNQNIRVEFNHETGESRVFDVKTVVEVDDEGFVVEDEPPADLEEEAGEEKKPAEEIEKKEVKKSEAESEENEDDEETEEEGDGRREPNPKTEITLIDAQDIKADAKYGDEIVIELEVPGSFGRTAAQTAKQVVTQKLREAERDILFDEFKAKEHEVVNAVIQRREGRLVLVDMGKITAKLPAEEQVPGEYYNPGTRLKVYIVSVTKGARGPEIIVSRAHSDIVRLLFAVEVPEISNGSVEIKAIAREAGSRSKVAVYTDEENIDPIGSCVGQRGSRIQTIINELAGEKIDIIEWHDDPEEFIRQALSPAKVDSVELNEEEKSAVVKVAEDQLSLAIGKAGQNVRLAAKLTDWKINIQAEGGESVSYDEAVAGELKKADEDKAETEEEKKDETTDEAVETEITDNSSEDKAEAETANEGKSKDNKKEASDEKDASAQQEDN